MSRVCLDLFAGLGGFSQAFEDADGWRVVTVDIKERFDPDVRADVLNLRPSDLPDADVVLASPPCTAFTIAGEHRHIDADGRPVSEFGRESIALVYHTVGLIEALNPEWWWLENPSGGLQQILDPPECQVCQCRYGRDAMKRTDLWGEIPVTFDVRTCSKGNLACHHESAPRGSKTGIQSDDLDAAERAKIPRELSEAVLEAVESAPEDTTEQSTLRAVADGSGSSPNAGDTDA